MKTLKKVEKNFAKLLRGFVSSLVKFQKEFDN